MHTSTRKQFAPAAISLNDGVTAPSTPHRTAPLVTSLHLTPPQETEDLELPADVVRKGVLAVLSGTAHATYFLLETHTDTPQAQIVAQLMITYEWSDWRNGVVW